MLSLTPKERRRKMKRMRLVIVLCLFVGLLMIGTAANAGESIGVFCWNLQPYTDIVCFDVENLNFAFALHGTQHGPAAYRVPIDGVAAVDEYSGLILMQWDFHYALNQFWAELAAAIDPASLNGFWNDNLGGSGDLVFVGPGPQSPEGSDGQPYAPRD